PTSGAGRRAVSTPRILRLGPEAVIFLPVTMPVMSLPFASVADTLRPSMAVASVLCCAVRRSADCLAMSSSFSTIVNCAVCCRNWVPSVGLMGFWYLSWATRSFRKVSLVSVADFVGEAVLLGAEAPTGVLIVFAISGPHIDCAVGVGRRGNRDRRHLDRLIDVRGECRAGRPGAVLRFPLLLFAGAHVERTGPQPRPLELGLQLVHVLEQQVPG